MKKTYILTGSDEKKFLADVFLSHQHAKGVVVFSHGFKGFKDWGTFPLMAENFTRHSLHYI